ncbi:MAG TPA: RNA 2',3'-cyclic phosphodiesterase [Verrucomicrobiae bacterium]|nr:RNA 2',3'-cyclic phosphodiesterase [Verrucomicrobiae bacterium]
MSEEGGKLRLFVAIAVPEEIKARLAALQREWRERLGRSSISWTRPENLHLTLRFLGDVPSNRLEDLTAALAAAAAPQVPLKLTVADLGCFPNSRRPRILWAGIRDEAGGLRELARRIVVATDSYSSQPAEERFAGHLTLARVRRIVGNISSTIGGFTGETAARAVGSWRAETVELVQSELHPAGSRYTTLARLPLAGVNL